MDYTHGQHKNYFRQYEELYSVKNRLELHY